MDIKDLEKLAKLCQKYGIKHYQSAQITLDFEHSPAIKTIAGSPAVQAMEEPELTEDDILNWSTNPLT